MSRKISKQDTICAYASLVNRQAVPPKDKIVNALATIDLPCSGIAPITGFSASIPYVGTLGDSTFEPSILAPFIPKNERIEQFWIYGEVVIVGLVLGKLV